MLDEPTAVVDGYSSYYSFCRTRSGYSGTATYCRDAVTPTDACDGLTGQFTNERESQIATIGLDKINDKFTPEELQNLDREGRAVLTEHTLR